VFLYKKVWLWGILATGLYGFLFWGCSTLGLKEISEANLDGVCKTKSLNHCMRFFYTKKSRNEMEQQYDTDTTHL